MNSNVEFDNIDSVVKCMQEIIGDLAMVGRPYGLFQKENGEGVFSELRSISSDARNEFLSRLELFRDICQASANNQFRLRDDLRLVWCAISRLGVRPPSDLFDFMSSGDSIEIYDASGRQVFRNFEFCNLTTYSLSELLLFPWTDLYDRNPFISEQISNEVSKLFSQKTVARDLNIDEHVGVEKMSGSGRKFSVKMKYFAPLMDSHQQVSYLLAGSSISRIN